MGLYHELCRSSTCNSGDKTVFRSDLWKMRFLVRFGNFSPLPRPTTSGTLELTWEMIPWRAPLHELWLLASKELRWSWTRKCSLSQVTRPNGHVKKCRDSAAVLFAVYYIFLSTFGTLPEKHFLCWGVWCLFEFLLSSRQHLELVFVTNAGVIGDATWRKQFCLKVSNHCSFPSITLITSFFGLPVQM